MKRRKKLTTTVTIKCTGRLAEKGKFKKIVPKTGHNIRLTFYNFFSKFLTFQGQETCSFGQTEFENNKCSRYLKNDIMALKFKRQKS